MRSRFSILALAFTASLLLPGCPSPTSPSADTVITVTAIPGVTAPVVDATPVSAITETAQYTGTVAWSGTPARFGASTVYTATITLTAKAGFTFTGVAANGFTVAGATATNPANSGVVTAVFPATGANLAAISDVTSSSQTSLTLKAVQGGTFNNGIADMTVSSFRMSQHEITMEQFVAVTGLANPSTSFSNVENGPVQYVNWYHALVFCNKLSVADGLTPVYSTNGTTDTNTWGTVPTTSSATWNGAIADWAANGYRLPTEAEWQFAARGGDSSNGYIFAGSNTVDDVAWYSSNAGSTTHTVGEKAANELGLYDMSGNVGEWCWDWYGSYQTSAQTDYRGTASGSYRVIRGGSWILGDILCTVAERDRMSPSTQSVIFGFRVVRP
jgi:formylglycine-generating enzyme